MKTIPLTQGYHAIVDDDDYEWLSQRKWCVSLRGSARPYLDAVRVVREDGKKRTIRMHREILSAPSGLVVDHINHDTLDNRRCNLRLCTVKQNAHNIVSKAGIGSSYKGVDYAPHAGAKPWRARIRVEKKDFHLGYFSTQEEAALAYDKAAVESFGAFACVNFSS